MAADLYRDLGRHRCAYLSAFIFGLLITATATLPALAARARDSDLRSRYLRCGRRTPRVLEDFSHRQILGLDRFFSELAKSRPRRGPFKAQRGAKVQLVGSTLAKSIAALERDVRPQADDIDLRVCGATLHDVIRAVKIGFKRTRRKPAEFKLTVKPPFKKGVTHVQIHVEGMQLDIGLYTKAAFAEPHQTLTVPQLMLDLEPNSPISRQIQAISTAEGMSRALRSGALHDPSGKTCYQKPDGTLGGDLFEKKLRYHHLPGASRDSAYEACFHAGYYAGKTEGWTLEEETAQVFANLEPKKLQTYFTGANNSRRIGYLLSAFRVKEGRDPHNTLDLFVNYGTLGKVFPGMQDVIDDPVRWNQTMQAFDHAIHSVAQQRRRQTDRRRRTREWVVGAILSQLSEENFAAALTAIPSFRRVTKNGDLINVRARIRNAYRFYHDQKVSRTSLEQLWHNGNGLVR